MFSLASISSLFCVAFVFLCKDDGIPRSKIQEDTHETAEALIRLVETLQPKHHVPYVPLWTWEKRPGMWESDVRFYFHGHEDMYMMRDKLSVYDNNMFGTAWITTCLLEAYRFGNTSKPSEETLSAALVATKDYRNQNVPYTNSLMTFWPQMYNETSKTWISYPINIHHLFDLADHVNFTIIEKILEYIGLGDIANIVKLLDQEKNHFLQAFTIPPDFDDTFVNLGLGSLLATQRADFPASHAQWRAQNTNLTSVFDALKKYAYRPMSDNLAVNTIDERTYFYLRQFLLEAKARGEDIALVPTWSQDIDEAEKMGPNENVMPFNINNVDVTVAANTIYGITSGILSGVIDVSVLDDVDIQQIYLNTSNLIATMIQTNFSSRPDLALLYYPSALEFYWFVARTYAELNSSYQNGPLPHKVLERVKTILDKTLHDYMTPDVLRQMKKDKDGNVYVDDFLGDGDLDRDNNPVIRGEDRLFTTGMAINALLSTWTTFDDHSRHLIWQKNTPAEVKVTVEKAAGFVNAHILGCEYKPRNAFFSGSIKGNTTFPKYPWNRVIKKGIYFGMEGVIPEVDYQAMLKKEHSVIDFHGYNHYPDYWPFWSSEPYTYVTTMLALAKFSNTHDPS